MLCSGLFFAEKLIDTHSVVDDINLKVDSSFGWTCKLLIFQVVTFLLTITNLIKKVVCFHWSEMHPDKFFNAKMLKSHSNR